MTSLEQLQWKSVEVSDDVITEEAGFFGLEELDGSEVIVKRSGDGWTLKPKSKKNDGGDNDVVGRTSVNISATNISDTVENTTKKRKKKKNRKKKKKRRKLEDATDFNNDTIDVDTDNNCNSTSIVPAAGYVDQHVIYYHQQSDWSRLGLNLN